MTKGTQENRRVKAELTGALLALLETRPFSRITVTDLTAKAGVARASYYRNFDSKQAIVEEAIDEICRELTAAKPFWDPARPISYDGLVKHFQHALTCVLARRAQLLALYRGGLGTLILESLNRYMEDAAGDMPCSSIQRYQLYFITGATYNVLMQWLESGARESPQALARTCADFLRGSPVTEMMAALPE